MNKKEFKSTHKKELRSQLRGWLKQFKSETVHIVSQKELTVNDCSESTVSYMKEYADKLVKMTIDWFTENDIKVVVIDETPKHSVYPVTSACYTFVLEEDYTKAQQINSKHKYFRHHNLCLLEITSAYGGPYTKTWFELYS